MEDKATPNSLPVLLVVLAFGIAGLLGCSDSGGSSPCQDSTAASIAGNWQGTASDNIYYSQFITMSLAQQGECIEGAYTSQLQYGTVVGAGTIEGTINSFGSFTATISFPNSNACPYRVNGSSDGISASGSYQAFQCTGAIVGTFSLSRL